MAAPPAKATDVPHNILQVVAAFPQAKRGMFPAQSGLAGPGRRGIENPLFLSPIKDGDRFFAVQGSQDTAHAPPQVKDRYSHNRPTF